MLKITPSGVSHSVADVSAYENTNPDGAQLDTNPYGLLALPGHQLVTDAGGNSLLDIDANGSISTVAAFLKFPGAFGPTDRVPTDVVVGPDGAYYVSTLSGVPFTPGAAVVFRVVPGATPTIYAANLTRSQTSRSGPTGRSTFCSTPRPRSSADPGSIMRIAPDGARTTIDTQGQLSRPAGLVVGPDGALYVSNNSASPSVGEVLRIEP